MRLNNFSDLSLRVLLFAAAHRDRLFTIEELASVYSASKGHLMKVVNLLTREGYLVSQRGRAGGLRLGREPEEINLGEVILKTENDFCLVECMRPNNTCILSEKCKLVGPLDKALAAFHAVMGSYTLADVRLNSEDFLP